MIINTLQTCYQNLINLIAGFNPAMAELGGHVTLFELNPIVKADGDNTQVTLKSKPASKTTGQLSLTYQRTTLAQELQQTQAVTGCAVSGASTTTLNLFYYKAYPSAAAFIEDVRLRLKMPIGALQYGGQNFTSGSADTSFNLKVIDAAGFFSKGNEVYASTPNPLTCIARPTPIKICSISTKAAGTKGFNENGIYWNSFDDARVATDGVSIETARATSYYYLTHDAATMVFTSKDFWMEFDYTHVAAKVAFRLWEKGTAYIDVVKSNNVRVYDGAGYIHGSMINSFVVGTTYRIAVGRKGTAYRVYINGVMKAAINRTQAFANNTSNMAFLNKPGSNALSAPGKIKNFTLILGMCPYQGTAPYTVVPEIDPVYPNVY